MFNINTGRDVIISRVSDGKIPLVSHQHENNGITKYISQLENRVLFNHKKTIALADRGVFLATTQNQDFHIGTRVKALTFKNGEQSEKIRLFITSSINKNQVLFTEYSANATNKLPDVTIKLPTKNDKIDYNFMEDVISGVQKLAIKGVVEYKDRVIKTTKKFINNKIVPRGTITYL